MTQTERQAYIDYRLEKSDETLEVARILVEHQKWNSAINRIYYAVYYAVSALLFRDELSTKTHAGVKSQFFLGYIKDGPIDARFGKVYSDLFDWRHKGDYNDFFDFSEADVKGACPSRRRPAPASQSEPPPRPRRGHPRSLPALGAEA